MQTLHVKFDCLSVSFSFLRWWPISCLYQRRSSDYKASFWLLSGSVWPSGRSTLKAEVKTDLCFHLQKKIKIFYLRRIILVFSTHASNPSVCISYHGLGVWFPDMIKYMQYEEYESKVRIFHRERVERFHFNFSLVNQIHREGEYIHDKYISVTPNVIHFSQFHSFVCLCYCFMSLFSFRFANIEIKSVKFESSLFENCYFEDIKSTNTFFENCTIKNTVFYNTGTRPDCTETVQLAKAIGFSCKHFLQSNPLYSSDLWQDKFKNCRMENATFLHPKKGCHLNFQEENDIVIYMVSFLGSLAVLPGNIISALFMDKIGRIRIIGDLRREQHRNDELT